jgi:hypothetical protein
MYLVEIKYNRSHVPVMCVIGVWWHILGLRCVCVCVCVCVCCVVLRDNVWGLIECINRLIKVTSVSSLFKQKLSFQRFRNFELTNQRK